GSRGKYSTSDATAEFFGKVRRLLDEQGIVWQTGELGKVDAGGGGTVAMYLAALDIDVIDIGTPVLSMHSPYEIISKLDLYSTYQAMYAFFRQ
ncbi:MAG: aminopeptidase, partial [Clostridia bacterium]|nr:aminopeptidase [Clostridia bacterium]